MPIYASLSHLPQLLSYAYLHGLAQQPQARQWLAYRGSGFTGFTRLGSSDPALWADIAVHNAAPLLAEIDRFSASLAELRAALAAGERTSLAAHFSYGTGFACRHAAHGRILIARLATPFCPPHHKKRGASP